MSDRKIGFGPGYLGKLSGRDSFNVKDAAALQKELDLDALEHYCRESKVQGFVHVGNPDVWLALIQRLREAEAHNGILQDELITRDMEANAKFAWERAAAELEAAEARIAQLERVREAAADYFSDGWGYDEDPKIFAIRAALAAVEESAAR